MPDDIKLRCKRQGCHFIAHGRTRTQALKAIRKHYWAHHETYMKRAIARGKQKAHKKKRK